MITKAQLANLLVRTASYLSPKVYTDQRELYIKIIKALEPDIRDQYIQSILNEEEEYNPIFEESDFEEVDFTKASIILELFDFIRAYNFNKEQFLVAYLYAVSKSEISSIEDVFRNMKEIAKESYNSKDVIDILWKNLILTEK